MTDDHPRTPSRPLLLFFATVAPWTLVAILPNTGHAASCQRDMTPTTLTGSVATDPFPAAPGDESIRTRHDPTPFLLHRLPETACVDGHSDSAIGLDHHHHAPMLLAAAKTTEAPPPNLKWIPLSEVSRAEISWINGPTGLTYDDGQDYQVSSVQLRSISGAASCGNISDAYVIEATTSMNCGSGGCLTQVLYCDEASKTFKIALDMLANGIEVLPSSTKGFRDLRVNGQTNYAWTGAQYQRRR
jgi:hypothetical protein